MLADGGGAILALQASLTPPKLAEHVAAAVNDPGQLAAMAAKARALGKPDAVERLADLVEAVAERRAVPSATRVVA